QPVCGSPGGYVDIDEISAEPIQPGVRQFDDRVKFDAESEEIIEINPNNNYDYGTLELFTMDCPDPDLHSFRDVYRAALFLGFDAAFSMPVDQTKLWNSPEGNELSLVEHFQNTISALHLDPQEMLSISIYSKNLDPATVIQEINNDDKLFLIKRATWDSKLGHWKVDAYEIGTGDRPAIGTEDDDWLITEDGQTLTIE
ncbi:hypothetical protein LCGC14_2788100, partial [marine sediment metagenome]